MIAALPTGQRGQILAAGLALLALLFVWLGVIGPIIDFYGAQSEQVGALQTRVAREAALIETLPLIRREAEASARAPARAVLAGNSDAIAGATLQEQVQAMAGTASAQLTSIETLPAEQVGSYRRIGVRVELSAQLTVVVALLRAIDQAQPSMLVDDIRLTATPVGPQNTQLPMDCAFTVYAFRIGTAKEDQP